MAFYSLVFILFLGILWGVARLVPGDPRQWILLAASYYFYWTWSGPFLLLLILVSLFNWLWGRRLASGRRPLVLWSGIALNLGVLWAFKTGLLGGGAYSWQLWGHSLLPIGVSFFTFQGISCLIDIYRGYPIPAPRPFFLYMAFWPTILSGPICRAPEMIPQFEAGTRPDWDDLCVGIRRIVTGFFLKLVLAETLWTGIRPGYGLRDIGDLPAGPLNLLDWLLLALGFGIWLYFDFAGYTHIVCGAARLLGVRLRENFRFPYHALSPQEFWTRWHMSLSSWIRDYVFFPLSILRRSTSWRYLALVFSMFLFGLWHGLTWNFALWGVYHGILLVLWRRFGPVKPVSASGIGAAALIRGGRWLATVLLICSGWLLFWVDAAGVPVVGSRGLDPGAAASLPGDLRGLVLALWGGYLALGWLARDIPAPKPASWRLRAGELLSLPVTVVMLILLIALAGNASPFAYVSF